MLLRAISLVVLASVCAIQCAAQPMPNASGNRFAFWVIGPTENARHWASEWIEASLRGAQDRPQRPLMPWRDAMQELLDYDPPSSLKPPPPEAGGPRIGSHDSVAWPWDMTIEMDYHEMSNRLRGVLRGGVLAQIVHIYDPESKTNSLAAEVMTPRGVGTYTRGLVVYNQSLRGASEELGRKLASLWAEFVADTALHTR